MTKTKKRGRWKDLYKTIDGMKTNEMQAFAIEWNVTDTHFRIAVSRIGKELGCKLSVHKVDNEIYKVIKGESYDRTKSKC